MRKLKMELSTESINALIRELEEYKNKTLIEKCREYVDRLADVGISIAILNTGVTGELGNVSALISYKKQLNPETDGARAVVIAKDLAHILNFWKLKDGTVRMAEVSPLLMAEFGSGLKAQNPKGIPGVGTGTFPPGGHGTEPGWYWQDLSGLWHYSQGIEPTQPMYNAWLTMYAVCEKVAIRVFSK